jgi:hypothetical protein
VQVAINSPTLAGFVRGIWHAYGFLGIGFSAIFACFWVASEGLLPSWWTTVPAIVIGSCALHEAGHLFAAKRLGVRAALLTKFGYAAITYKRPDIKAVRVITVAGPLAAVLVCLVAAMFFASFLKWIFVMTAIAHLCCLLPVAADGQLLWRGYDK